MEPSRTERFSNRQEASERDSTRGDKHDAALDETEALDRAPADSKSDASNPTHIGRYRIDGVLGTGTFGIVYRGFDAPLQRAVAIKVPSGRWLDDELQLQSSLNEARAAARLDHPHIVPVYDVGREDGGQYYIVSKLVEGQDLGKATCQGRWSCGRTIDLIATIADALHYAHGKGLVHRDVKPGNILLDHDGRAYLVDFGLALADEQLGAGPDWLGTPAYMSPEQALGQGHRVDGRSDIFSLAVVLYELLTGTRPFRSANRHELLDQITSMEARPLRQIDDAIPAAVEHVCLKALSKSLAQRHATASDFASDLRAALGADAKPGGAKGGGLTADDTPTAARRSPQRRAAAFISIIAAVALVLGVWMTNRQWNTRAAGTPDSTSGIVASPELTASAQNDAGQSAQLLVQTIDVKHFENTVEGDLPRGTIGQQTIIPRLGDRVQIVARLSKPAYAYLIAFRPDGQAELCFPESEETPPPLTDTPRYPVGDPLDAYGLREGTGLWVFVAVASEQPLPSYRDWLSHQSADLPTWRPIAADWPGIVWWDDGLHGLDALTPSGSGSLERSKGESLEGPAAVIQRLTDALRNHDQASTVAAIGFSVVARP